MLKEGFYEDAVFRFVLRFSENFPAQLPSIRFASAMFHPLVGEDGTLDTDALFPSWRYEIGKQLLDVLTRVKAIFADKAYFEHEGSLNPAAAHLFRSEPDAFLQRASECARQSRKDFHALPLDCPYRFNRVEKVPDDVRALLDDTQVSLPARQGGEEETTARTPRVEAAAERVTKIYKNASSGNRTRV